jgi:probable rRNA maturation factor
MLKIQFNQHGLRGGQCLPHDLVRKLARVASKHLNITQKAEVSVAFVSEKEMRALNKQYRKKDAVTDVLTFPLEGEEIGEILICYAQARRQANCYGTAVRTEVLLLIVHGLLHLAGYHHKTKKEDEYMRALTQKIMHALSHESRL